MNKTVLLLTSQTRWKRTGGINITKNYRVLWENRATAVSERKNKEGFSEKTIFKKTTERRGGYRQRHIAYIHIY